MVNSHLVFQSIKKLNHLLSMGISSLENNLSSASCWKVAFKMNIMEFHTSAAKCSETGDNMTEDLVFSLQIYQFFY